MRLPFLSFVLIAAGLAADIVPAPAQSPTSYPWCARIPKTDGDATSCYFTSYRQCMTTLSGIGGYCYQSPYYHAAAAKGRPRILR
jgi:uncharacterized protein DUF3551